MRLISQKKKWGGGAEKGFCAQEPTGSCPVSKGPDTLIFFLALSALCLRSHVDSGA